MYRVAANRFQALNEKNGRKGAAADLVRDVAFIVFDADSGEFLGQVGIAEIPAL